MLDGWGGVHAFGSAPDVQLTRYWYGWDIARDVVLASDSGGYVLDGFGGVHAFGTAAPVSFPAYFSNDVARGVILSSSDGGYVVFQTGVLRPFGSAPAVNLGLMGLPLGQAIG